MARKAKDNEKSETVGISLDKTALKRIEAHMKRREYSTRSAAARDLIRIGASFEEGKEACGG